MPKSVVYKKQVAALKKLRDLDLYSGKLPRAGAELTRYQKDLIAAFDDVLKRKAVVVTPENAKEYSLIYKVKGKKVIVPRGKGEKISINKNGNIARTRKGPRGEKITSTAKRQKPGKIPEPPTPSRRVQYAVPFARKLGKGRYRLEWKRFPTWEMLASFMAEYEKAGRYDDWANFVFEEEISAAPLAERNEALNRAAVKWGRAKSETEFETGNQLTAITRAGRRNRRRKGRKRGQS